MLEVLVSGKLISDVPARDGMSVEDFRDVAAAMDSPQSRLTQSCCAAAGAA